MTALRIVAANLALAAIIASTIALWPDGPKPAPRDFDTELLAIEEELVGAERDAEAWAAFGACAERFGAWWDAYRDEHTTAEDAWNAVDLEHAFVPAAGLRDGANVAASERMARAYTASDLHECLPDLLAREGLRPPSFTEQQDDPWRLIEEPTPSARRMAIAEATRFSLAATEGDTDTAARAAQHVEALSHIPVGQPCLVTLRTHVDSFDALRKRTDLLLEVDALTPDLAARLLPIFQRFHKGEPARARRMVEADEVSIQRAIDMAYAGEFEDHDFGNTVPRGRWISHLECAEAVSTCMRDAGVYLEAGPGTTPPPTVPFPDDDEGQWEKSPLPNFIPAIERLGADIFRYRAARAKAIIRLAILIYTNDHAAPPPTLDALVDAGLLGRVPTDPYAPDGVFVYEANPDTPGGYTLRGADP